MVRNITGFAVFAFLAMVAFKLLAAVFGGLLGLILTILWWAFIGFVIYVLIKMFSPSTAAKIRDTIRGEGSSTA
jgi:hypothetical protein